MACPACRSPGIIYDPETGEKCCGVCGMVVGAAASGTNSLTVAKHSKEIRELVGSADAANSR